MLFVASWIYFGDSRVDKTGQFVCSEKGLGRGGYLFEVELVELLLFAVGIVIAPIVFEG